MPGKDNKKKFIKSLIEELEEIMNNKESLPVDLAYTLAKYSMSIMIAAAEFESGEKKNEVFINAISLLNSKTESDLKLLESMLEEAGYKMDCSVCPYKKVCSVMEKNNLSSELDNLFDNVSNNSGKWN